MAEPVSHGFSLLVFLKELVLETQRLDNDSSWNLPTPLAGGIPCHPSFWQVCTQALLYLILLHDAQCHADPDMHHEKLQNALFDQQGPFLLSISGQC